MMLKKSFGFVLEPSEHAQLDYIMYSNIANFPSHPGKSNYLCHIQRYFPKIYFAFANI